MTQPTLIKKIGIRFLSLLLSGAFVSMVSVAQAGGPPRRGKPVESEEKVEESVEERTQAAPASAQTTETEASEDDEEATQLPAQFPLPSARLSDISGPIVIKLINETNAVITYQVVGGTRDRSLGEQSEVELAGFEVPMTLTYQRDDDGLLLVIPEATESNVLEVRFQATGDFNLDTKALEINDEGSVFLN
ncbi:MAG: hypothetical protein ACFBSC_14150 [Microcoleaceae cyanobacterium]